MFIAKYGNELFLLSDMVTSILKNFSTEEDLKDIVGFFDNITDFGNVRNIVEQSIAKIKSNIAWKKNNSNILQKWLQAN